MRDLGESCTPQEAIEEAKEEKPDKTKDPRKMLDEWYLKCNKCCCNKHDSSDGEPMLSSVLAGLIY